MEKEISHSLSFDNLKEMIEVVEKLKADEKVINLNFSGSYNRSSGDASYGVSWSTVEEL